MDEIEYLEEYEDLILPTMSSHSAPTKSRATSNVVSMADDEDSSSIDQDIFESLFDDHSDDESIMQKKVPNKLSQRSERISQVSRISMDSLDLLVKDLGVPLNADVSKATNKPISKPSTAKTTQPSKVIQKATTTTASIKGTNTPKPASSENSKASNNSDAAERNSKTKCVATVRPTVQQNLAPTSSKPTNERSHDTSTNRALPSSTAGSMQNAKVASVTHNSSKSTPTPTTASTSRKQISAATSTTASSSSAVGGSKSNASTSASPPKRIMERSQTTIIKPEKPQIKDPAEDPLSLENIGNESDSDTDSFVYSDISADTFVSLSDVDDEERQVIELSNDSNYDRANLDKIRGSTPSPTVSDDDKSDNEDSPEKSSSSKRFEKSKHGSVLDRNVAKKLNVQQYIDTQASTSGQSSKEKAKKVSKSPNTSDNLLDRIDTVLSEVVEKDGKQLSDKKQIEDVELVGSNSQEETKVSECTVECSSKKDDTVKTAPEANQEPSKSNSVDMEEEVKLDELEVVEEAKAEESVEEISDKVNVSEEVKSSKPQDITDNVKILEEADNVVVENSICENVDFKTSDCEVVAVETGEKVVEVGENVNIREYVETDLGEKDSTAQNFKAAKDNVDIESNTRKDEDSETKQEETKRLDNKDKKLDIGHNEEKDGYEKSEEKKQANELQDEIKCNKLALENDEPGDDKSKEENNEVLEESTNLSVKPDQEKLAPEKPVAQMDIEKTKLEAKDEPTKSASNSKATQNQKCLRLDPPSKSLVVERVVRSRTPIKVKQTENKTQSARNEAPVKTSKIGSTKLEDFKEDAQTMKSTPEIEKDTKVAKVEISAAKHTKRVDQSAEDNIKEAVERILPVRSCSEQKIEFNPENTAVKKSTTEINSDNQVTSSKFEMKNESKTRSQTPQGKKSLRTSNAVVKSRTEQEKKIDETNESKSLATRKSTTEDQKVTENNSGAEQTDPTYKSTEDNTSGDRCCDTFNSDQQRANATSTPKPDKRIRGLVVSLKKTDLSKVLNEKLFQTKEKEGEQFERDPKVKCVDEKAPEEPKASTSTEKPKRDSKDEATVDRSKKDPKDEKSVVKSKGDSNKESSAERAKNESKETRSTDRGKRDSKSERSSDRERRDLKDERSSDRGRRDERSSDRGRRDERSSDRGRRDARSSDKGRRELKDDRSSERARRDYKDGRSADRARVDSRDDRSRRRWDDDRYAERFRRDLKDERSAGREKRDVRGERYADRSRRDYRDERYTDRSREERYINRAKEDLRDERSKEKVSRDTRDDRSSNRAKEDLKGEKLSDKSNKNSKNETPADKTKRDFKVEKLADRKRTETGKKEDQKPSKVSNADSEALIEKSNTESDQVKKPEEKKEQPTSSVVAHGEKPTKEIGKAFEEKKQTISERDNENKSASRGKVDQKEKIKKQTLEGKVPESISIGEDANENTDILHKEKEGGAETGGQAENVDMIGLTESVNTTECRNQKPAEIAKSRVLTQAESENTSEAKSTEAARSNKNRNQKNNAETAENRTDKDVGLTQISEKSLKSKEEVVIERPINVETQKEEHQTAAKSSTRIENEEMDPSSDNALDISESSEKDVAASTARSIDISESSSIPTESEVVVVNPDKTVDISEISKPIESEDVVSTNMTSDVSESPSKTLEQGVVESSVTAKEGKPKAKPVTKCSGKDNQIKAKASEIVETENERFLESKAEMLTESPNKAGEIKETVPHKKPAEEVGTQGVIESTNNNVKGRAEVGESTKSLSDEKTAAKSDTECADILSYEEAEADSLTKKADVSADRQADQGDRTQNNTIDAQTNNEKATENIITPRELRKNRNETKDSEKSADKIEGNKDEMPERNTPEEMRSSKEYLDVQKELEEVTNEVSRCLRTPNTRSHAETRSPATPQTQSASEEEHEGLTRRSLRKRATDHSPSNTNELNKKGAKTRNANQSSITTALTTSAQKVARESSNSNINRSATATPTTAAMRKRGRDLTPNTTTEANGNDKEKSPGKKIKLDHSRKSTRIDNDKVDTSESELDAVIWQRRSRLAGGKEAPANKILQVTRSKDRPPSAASITPKATAADLKRKQDQEKSQNSEVTESNKNRIRNELDNIHIYKKFDNGNEAQAVAQKAAIKPTGLATSSTASQGPEAKVDGAKATTAAGPVDPLEIPVKRLRRLQAIDGIEAVNMAEERKSEELDKRNSTPKRKTLRTSGQVGSPRDAETSKTQMKQQQQPGSAATTTQKNTVADLKRKQDQEKLQNSSAAESNKKRLRPELENLQTSKKFDNANEEPSVTQKTTTKPAGPITSTSTSQRYETKVDDTKAKPAAATVDPLEIPIKRFRRLQAIDGIEAANIIEAHKSEELDIRNLASKRKILRAGGQAGTIKDSSRSEIIVETSKNKQAANNTSKQAVKGDGKEANKSATSVDKGNTTTSKSTAILKLQASPTKSPGSKVITFNEWLEQQKRVSGDDGEDVQGEAAQGPASTSSDNAKSSAVIVSNEKDARQSANVREVRDARRRKDAVSPANKGTRSQPETAKGTSNTSRGDVSEKVSPTRGTNAQTQFKRPSLPQKSARATPVARGIIRASTPGDSRRSLNRTQPNGKQSTLQKVDNKWKLRKLRVRINRSSVAAYFKTLNLDKAKMQVKNADAEKNKLTSRSVKEVDPLLGAGQKTGRQITTSDISQKRVVMKTPGSQLAQLPPLTARPAVTAAMSSAIGNVDPTKLAGVLPKLTKVPSTLGTDPVDSQNEPQISPTADVDYQKDVPEELSLLTPMKSVAVTSKDTTSNLRVQQQKQQSSTTFAGAAIREKRVSATSSTDSCSTQQSLPIGVKASSSSSTSTTKDTHVPFTPVVPKEELVDDQQQHSQQSTLSRSAAAPSADNSSTTNSLASRTLEIAAATNSALNQTPSSDPSGYYGLTPTQLDSNGTRLYSFLHPAKYNRNHGCVLLDYCCPNLDGPMPAIDPTRIHAQVQAGVRELPAYIVMTTKLITRADLEANKNVIPASIRQKVEKITADASNASANQSALAVVSGTPNASMSIPSTAHLTSASKSSLNPTITALQKHLPATTIITPKLLPAATTSSLASPLNVLNSNSQGGTPTTTTSMFMSDYQRSLLRTSVRQFDARLKKYYYRVAMLSFSDRQTIINNIINSTSLTPKDVECAVRLLDEYASQISLLPISSALGTSKPTTPQVMQSISKAITTPTTNTVARTATMQQQLQTGQIPVLDKDNSLLGYQMTSSTNTLSKSTISTRSSIMSTTTKNTSLPHVKTAQDSPRIFYTKPPMQTSTPIATTTSSGITPQSGVKTLSLRSTQRIGREVTIRQIPTKLGSVSSRAPTATATPPSTRRLPTLTRNPHLTTSNATPTSTSSVNSTSTSETITTRSAVTISTAPKRMTRASAAAKVIVITQNNEGDNAALDECILPDGNNSTEIKRERVDDDFVGGN